MSLVCSSFPLCCGGGEARKRQHFSAPSWPVLEKKKQRKCWRKGKTCFSDALGKSKLIYTNMRSSCPQLEDWYPVALSDGLCQSPSSSRNSVRGGSTEPCVMMVAAPLPQQDSCRTTLPCFLPSILHVDVQGTKPKAHIKSICCSMLFSNSFLLNLEFAFSKNVQCLKPAFFLL